MKDVLIGVLLGILFLFMLSWLVICLAEYCLWIQSIIRG